MRQHKGMPPKIPPGVRLLFQSAFICPRHPKALREVIKRLAAYQLHGSLTPTVVLTEPPSLPAADCTCVMQIFTARAVTGREYHCPHCLLSPYREQPDIHSRRFLASCGKGRRRPIKIVESVCFLSRRSWRNR